MLRAFDLNTEYGPCAGEMTRRYSVVEDDDAAGAVPVCGLCVVFPRPTTSPFAVDVVTGISRKERWERAEHFGLEPPRAVLELVEAHGGNEQYTQCVWHGRI